jgi:hypothetical protein
MACNYSNHNRRTAPALQTSVWISIMGYFSMDASNSLKKSFAVIAPAGYPPRMHDSQRFQLLGGPYRMPRCRIGGHLTCKLRRVRMHQQELTLAEFRRP